MLKKVFVNVIFEKKKFLIFFILISTLVTVFLGVQTMVITNQYEQVASPDMEISGTLDDDGLFRYKMYNDINGLAEQLRSNVDKNSDIYGITCRNLLTVNDTFNKVSYSVYGVDDSFLDGILSKFIIDGKLPQKGKKEVLIGSLAARYFNVKVGDAIQSYVTLDKEPTENDMGKYIVSGILSDNVDYFKGGIFISKDTYENTNDKVDENLVLVYVNSETAYNKIDDSLNNVADNYKIGSVSSFYQQKTSLQNTLFMNLLSILAVSLIVVFLMFSYLMKGITKKIGLLKSLGMSDFYIVKAFVGGLGIVTVATTGLGLVCSYFIKIAMNQNISKFLGYSVEQYKFNGYVYLSTIVLNLIMYAAVFITISILSRMVSPRDAMLKN